MTETPQNTQPKIVVAVDPAHLGSRLVYHGDAIGFDMPPAAMVERWKAGVAQIAGATARWMRDAQAGMRALGIQAHRGTHQLRALRGHLQRNGRGLRLRGVQRKRRLALVRCPICHPTANPKPLPRGLGTAYAARRRQR